MKNKNINTHNKEDIETELFSIVCKENDKAIFYYINRPNEPLTMEYLNRCVAAFQYLLSTDNPIAIALRIAIILNEEKKSIQIK